MNPSAVAQRSRVVSARGNPSSTMTTPTRSTPPQSPSPQTYDRLLVAAQAAQSAADRAVAELAQIKRTMAEAPRVLKSRQEELDRAKIALETARHQADQAREQLAAKQSEAARLIEAAAEAQKALAYALMDVTDAAPSSSPSPSPSSPSMPRTGAAAAPSSTAPRTAAPLSRASAATLGPNRYTPMPAMHPADLHTEVVDYLKERDALCPSCGHSLRAIPTASCPGCKLNLSLTVLRSVRAHPMTAPTAIWIVRALAALGLLLSLYMSMIVFTGGRPIGCGGGSDCHFVVRSAWSKLMGIPVAAFAAPLCLAVLVSSLFLRVGLTDMTRRRGWSALTLAATTAGLAGLWFLFVQVALLGAICPHCVVADVAVIALAIIVLVKAPLGRVEDLPEPAKGRIEIPKATAVSLAIIALVVAALFAGVHFIASKAKGPQDRQQVLGLPKNVEPPRGGLMMQGLSLPPQSPEQEQTPSVPEERIDPIFEFEAPATPAVPPVPPVPPAATQDAPKAADEKGDEKSDEKSDEKADDKIR